MNNLRQKVFRGWPLVAAQGAQAPNTIPCSSRMTTVMRRGEQPPKVDAAPQPVGTYDSTKIGHIQVRANDNTMSQTAPAAPSSSSSADFLSVFNAALEAYEKTTKNKLLTHPLAAQLQSCDSPADILPVLRHLVQQLDQNRSRNERLRNWLDPTVNVLFAFSATLGEGVGMVIPKFLSHRDRCFDRYLSGVLTCKSDIFRDQYPSLGEYSLRFLGAGNCDDAGCQAAKDANASQDVLIDLFSRIERFFKRLESYTEVQPTAAMTGIIIEIMVEVLAILAIATKEIIINKDHQVNLSTPVILSLTHSFLRNVCEEVVGKEQD